MSRSTSRAQPRQPDRPRNHHVRPLYWKGSAPWLRWSPSAQRESVDRWMSVPRGTRLPRRDVPRGTSGYKLNVDFFEALLEDELARLTRADQRRSCPEASGASPGFTSSCETSPPYPSAATTTSVLRITLRWLPPRRRPPRGMASVGPLRAWSRAICQRKGPRGPHWRPFSAVQPRWSFRAATKRTLGVLTALAGPTDLVVSRRPQSRQHHRRVPPVGRAGRGLPTPRRAGGAASAGRRKHLPQTAPRDGVAVQHGWRSRAPLAALAEAAREPARSWSLTRPMPLGCSDPTGADSAPPRVWFPTFSSQPWGRRSARRAGSWQGVSALRDHLVNRARTFIYTTALRRRSLRPPPQALHIVEGAEGAARRRALAQRCALLAESLLARNLIAHPPDGAIVPVVLGSDSRALAVSAALSARGFFVPAMRPPTVPAGSARLRITLSSGRDRGRRNPPRGHPG